MRKFLFVFLISLTCGLVAFAADEGKMTAEQLVAKHLASIGTPEARAAVHAAGVDGTARFLLNVGGAGQIEGPLKLGSEGRKFRLVMRFNSPTYMGEDIVTDGSNVRVANYVQDKATLLGAFFFPEKPLVQEGLFGGALTTSWALADLKATQAKVYYNGLKKIEGRDLHELSYEPKKAFGDMHIRLYFEPDTFRHVMTVYDLRIVRSKSATVSSTARSSGGIVSDEGRQTLREYFANFTTVDGITIPTSWNIKLANDSANSSDIGWNITVQNVTHGTIDPAVFKVK